METRNYSPQEELSPEKLKGLSKVRLSPEACQRIGRTFQEGQYFYGEPRNPADVKTGASILCKNLYDSNGKRVTGNITCIVE